MLKCALVLLPNIQALGCTENKDPFGIFRAFSGIKKFPTLLVKELCTLYHYFIFSPFCLQVRNFVVQQTPLQGFKKRGTNGENRWLTGPRYLMHCCWSFHRGHLSIRLTSFPSPISSLHFQDWHISFEKSLKFSAEKFLIHFVVVPVIITSKRRAACSGSGAMLHNKTEDYGHNDGEDQSANRKNNE